MLKIRSNNWQRNNNTLINKSLQHNYVYICTGEEVGTKYGHIKFGFREDSKIQNLHTVYDTTVTGIAKENVSSSIDHNRIYNTRTTSRKSYAD